MVSTLVLTHKIVNTNKPENMYRRMVSPYPYHTRGTAESICWDHKGPGPNSPNNKNPPVPKYISIYLYIYLIYISQKLWARPIQIGDQDVGSEQGVIFIYFNLVFF